MKNDFLIKAISLLTLLMSWMGAVAQEAYSVFTEGDSTLKFYYDKMRSSRPGFSYSLNSGNSIPAWFNNCRQVSQVVFDPSFAAARPTSTRGWFYFMDRQPLLRL